MRRGSIAAPAILLALGIIFLLNNFGYLPWEIWSSLWRFWPIILILLGLEVLIGRATPGKFLLLVIFLIFIVPLLLSNILPKEVTGKDTIDISQNVGTLIGGKLEVNIPAGELKVEPEASYSAKLAEGQVSFSKVAGKPEVTFNNQNGVGALNIHGGTSSSVSLKLNTNVPYILDLSSGATNTILNLDRMQLNQLKLNVGTAKVSIKFPNFGFVQAEIQAGAATIDIEIPREVEAKIHSESNALNLNLDQGRFKKDGDSYFTSNYKPEGRNRVDIDLKTSIANVSIK